MRIDDLRIAPIDEDRVEVSANAGGCRLFYRLPERWFQRSAVGDALVLSVLVPAMRAGTALKLPNDAPISSSLEAHLDGIQRVMVSWNAALRHTDIVAQRYTPQPLSSHVGLFYAGGVDSSYSLLTHLAEIDSLLIVFGFDHTPPDSEAARSIVRNGAFARRLNKDLVPVETNHSRFLRELGVSRAFAYGTTLASVAHLCGLRRCYIASSHSAANLRPSGSHPALDHRFSNGATEIIHDDISFSRLAKTQDVARRADFLANLVVCWERPNENCGKCWKCLRTMTALRLCGIVGPFPPLTDIRQVQKMAANIEVEFVIELLMAARTSGDDELARALRKGLRSQDRREAIRHIDQAFAGGWMRRWLMRRRAEAYLIKAEQRPDLYLSENHERP